MSTSSMKQGVWDSHDDRALALSPTLGNDEICLIPACKNRIGAGLWINGYRVCGACMERFKENERSEQIPATDTIAKNSIEAENARYLDALGDRKFKNALLAEQAAAEESEVRAKVDKIWAAIPKEWKLSDPF